MYIIIIIIHMVCVHVGMVVSHFYFCSKIKFRHDLLSKMTSIKQCTFLSVKEQGKHIHQKTVVSSFGEYISLCLTFPCSSCFLVLSLFFMFPCSLCFLVLHRLFFLTGNHSCEVLNLLISKMTYCCLVELAV